MSILKTLSSQKKYILIALMLGVTSASMVLYEGRAISAEDKQQAPAAPQAMPVATQTVALQDVQVWKNFSGNVVAVDRAEIRPQVSGRITELRFEDGQHVNKGDILVVIDPRPYMATLAQAEAALQVAKTEASLADKEYQRAQSLIKTNAIAQSLLDERLNNHQAALAAVQGAEALVESAKINLDYAYVKAPISGKVSRAEITEGNLVQSGSSAPVLTSIVSNDKVYVDFEIDERTYINSVRNLGNEDASKIPVRVKLISSDIEYKGFLRSFDNRIDQASGTIRARAIFNNEQGLLLPGMSVSVLMGSNNSSSPKILITERAIGTDQDRKFVYTVNGDGIAKYREVTIGDSINGQRIILSGLQAGEKVISEGLVRIRPGMPVTPKDSVTAATTETTAH